MFGRLLFGGNELEAIFRDLEQRKQYLIIFLTIFHLKTLSIFLLVKLVNNISFPFCYDVS
ncbi:hypothetical protein HanXRQr2_Chr16g0734711 [Helianthus annuus]|uniref:Uncharacterized protein n=1 Tax=Helianthus annuus TaxID=4232 RepID=A0A9K3DPD6_HELAN|nr:hypothetical protein HanXRQr2_Chr16g0734711 [Helianthus annuus]